MKPFRFCCTTLFAFIFSCTLSGCFQHYFNVNPVAQTSAYPTVIEQAKQMDRYFILHSGKNVYAITTIQLDEAKQQMELQLNELDTLHTVYVKRPTSRRYRPGRGESGILTEILFFKRYKQLCDEPVN